MPKKNSLLAGMLILCIILGAAIISSAIKPVPTASAALPVILKVVFPNGTNSTNEAPGTNFTVSINIYNAPATYPNGSTEGVGFYSITIGWNTSALSLQTGTSADFVEGTWMDSFGSTLFTGPTINTSNATVPDGLLTYAAGASGNGTMFNVHFHAITKSPAADITILGLNIPAGSYLLTGALTGVVNITEAFNGGVTVVPEFPSSALLPLFLIGTTIATAAATVSSRKRKIPPRVS
jgi:hypothetical protein